MKFEFRRAILPTGEANSLNEQLNIPDYIVQLQREWGHWNGICHVDTDPPSESDPPADTGATSAQDAPKDEPLGESGKKALDSERSQRKALEKQLKAVEQKFKDVDPTAYQEALSRLSEFESKEADRKQKELESQQDYEAAKQALEKRHQEQLTAKQTELTGQVETAQSQATLYKSALSKLAIDQALSTAFLDKEVNGDPSSLDLFIQLPSVRSQLTTTVELDENTKQPTIKIETPNGDSVVEFLKANRSQFLRLCKPDNPNSGGGTPAGPVSGSARTTNGTSFDDLMKKVTSR